MTQPISELRYYDKMDTILLFDRWVILYIMCENQSYNDGSILVPFQDNEWSKKATAISRKRLATNFLCMYNVDRYYTLHFTV